MSDENISRLKAIPSSYKTALIILGAVALYFAIGTLTAKEKSSTDTQSHADERPDFVVLTQTVTAIPRAVEVSFNGRTEAGRRVTVRAETPGQVIDIPADEGTMVSAGDVLCKLDPESRNALVAEARAAFVKADTDYQATVKLFEEGFAADAAVKSAAAARDGAQARLTQARQDLSNIAITAPFDGLVAERLVEPGDVLSAGAGCAVLADLSDIVVAGGVPASQAELLSVGDAAKVSIGDRPPFAAAVSFVSDVADMRTRAFRIELKAKNADGLSDGLNARAAIIAGTATAATIPRTALVFNDAGQLGVRTLSPTSIPQQGIVSFTPVTLSGEDNIGMQVIGIEGSKNIIIRGQNYVSTGTTIAYEAVTPEQAN
ncbi:MAG: efflux RND transporter periplasmic adaptor subunit [Pseudomonadota bacterium]